MNPSGNAKATRRRWVYAALGAASTVLLLLLFRLAVAFAPEDFIEEQAVLRMLFEDFETDPGNYFHTDQIPTPDGKTSSEDYASWRDRVTLLKVTQPPDAADFRRIAALSHLEHLVLREAPVEDADLVCIARLPHLKTLELSGDRITDDGLLSLSENFGIEELRLGSPHIGDAGVRHIGNLGHLRCLVLSSDSITDDGLSHLSELSRLEYLDLSSVLITDEGLQHLQSMTSLRTLVIRSRKVTDTALARLAGAGRSPILRTYREVLWCEH